MDIIEKGLEFEQRKHRFVTTSDRILASREVKALILGINEIYKKNKDGELMDLMKRLTVIKQKIEKKAERSSLNSSLRCVKLQSLEGVKALVLLPSRGW